MNVKQKSLFRDIEKELKIALKFSKVILISGSSKVGKTMLVNKYKEGRAYYNLKSKINFDLANSHPEIFINRMKFPCIIENIEVAKVLLSLIFVRLKNLNPGDVIITTNEINSPELTKFVSIVDNNISTYELGYLTHFERNKIEAFDLDFTNLKIPYYLKTEDNLLNLANRAYEYGSQLKYVKLIEELRENAFKLNYSALEIDLIDKVLIELAKSIGKQINVTEIANKFDINKYTVNTIINLLERYKVIFKLDPIVDEELKYVVKTSKIYFTSINLLCKLLKIKNGEVLLLSDYRQEILNNYLILMIMNQYKTKGRNILFNYYENNNGVKIDLIINNIGKVNLIQFQLRILNEKKLKQGEKVFQKTRLKIGRSIVVSYDIDRSYDDTVYSLITPNLFA